jgi:S1-C subfamily serine protease
MPKDFATTRVSPSTEGESAETRIYRNQEVGLIVGDLPAPLAKQFGVAEGSGVLVMRVESQSVAQRAGVRQGMVISQVGTTPIKNVADFKATLEGLPLNDGIPLQLQTQNGPKTVTLRNR